MNIKISREEPKICNEYSDIRDPTKRATLCMMPTAIRYNDTLDNYKEKWLKDIYIFRDKCKDKNKYVDESPEIKKKRMEVELEAKWEKYERIKEKENEDVEKIIESKIQQRAKHALQVVEKETKYEQLALEEELMRERDEENKLNQMVEEEQEKKVYY